ncbi:trypsin-like peptidase domain-containing protein [Pseudoalteromonas aliena]|uniref:Serine protease n=1 Tax=Pseudoalteromonas aliena SW19 TaxID=1314866 RepID=A0ABR9E0W3_9GAMM|nr:trypsin-like peptidase domain-containing protein [Pseudoalteromonas aliena]MBE0360023.1 hypothetical protein [Pseudoalteromonas aliena SW19]
MIRYVDPLSCTSLFIEPCFNEIGLSVATGFLLKYCEDTYLITNWHVVSGKDADSLECLDKKNLAIPNNLLVSFHKKGSLGEWVKRRIDLLDDNEDPLWLEHPLGSEVDVVVIKLDETDDIEIYTLDYQLKDKDMVPVTAMPVSVVGYPFGLSAGANWPIWKTGNIASDHGIDFEVNRPAFLIDATTRAGMSGSPVVLRADSYQTSDGNYEMAGGIQTRFLGVYAGRIHGQSEIGRVWRPFVIQETIENRLLFNDESMRFSPSRIAKCPCNRGLRFKECCGKVA